MNRKKEIYNFYKKSEKDLEAYIREGVNVLTDFLPWYKAQTLGDLNSQYPDTEAGVSKILTEAGIFKSDGTLNSAGNINPEKYVIGMYKFIVKLGRSCNDIFKHKGSGKQHKISDIIKKVNFTSGAYSTLVNKFCTDKKGCWKLVVEPVGRPLLGGTVQFGTFYNTCLVSRSTPTRSTTSTTSSSGSGKFPGCDAKQFTQYMYETHGKHTPQVVIDGLATVFKVDHHHGIDKQRDTNATASRVMRKFFELSTTCKNYPCTYPGFVAWYNDNIRSPLYNPYTKGELQPDEAIFIMNKQIKTCRESNIIYNPIEESYSEPEVTPSGNIIYRTPERKTKQEVVEVPQQTVSEAPQQTYSESAPQYTETSTTNCEWNEREVVRLLNNLLTGNKPLLAPGSKELQGTFTLAQERVSLPILGFIRYNRGLTGKQLRSNTEKYIERLITSSGFFGGVGKALSTFFGKPNPAQILQVGKLVYRTLMDDANAPSTGTYTKFCHENAEMQDSINRAKVYFATQILAQGNQFFGSKKQDARQFSGFEDNLMETAKDRRDIRNQKVLRNKDTIPLSTASRKKLRRMELLKISSKIK